MLQCLPARPRRAAPAISQRLPRSWPGASTVAVGTRAAVRPEVRDKAGGKGAATTSSPISNLCVLWRRGLGRNHSLGYWLVDRRFRDR